MRRILVGVVAVISNYLFWWFIEWGWNALEWPLRVQVVFVIFTAASVLAAKKTSSQTNTSTDG